MALHNLFVLNVLLRPNRPIPVTPSFLFLIPRYSFIEIYTDHLYSRAMRATACCQFAQRWPLAAASNSGHLHCSALLPLRLPAGVQRDCAIESLSRVRRDLSVCERVSPSICPRRWTCCTDQLPLLPRSCPSCRVVVVSDCLNTIAADGVVRAPVRPVIADQSHQLHRLPARPSSHLSRSGAR